ncbi:hypothetical protein FRX31_019821 [Thalictrum thalictroides]|uniref:Myb/SANT-like domain-containing protein n=1 Tax=Thalictrum thalictroides TaxID=46969 RepID=A0A7J6VZN6_THATH|nr:hypothetical protein FRX31_019821 [Thalictrum thalictroides]
MVERNGGFKIRWSLVMDEIMLETLANRKEADGCPCVCWSDTTILEVRSNIFKASSMPVTNEKVRDRIQYYFWTYLQFRGLMNIKGFTWNERFERVVATEETWEAEAPKSHFRAEWLPYMGKFLVVYSKVPMGVEQLGTIAHEVNQCYGKLLSYVNVKNRIRTLRKEMVTVRELCNKPCSFFVLINARFCLKMRDEKLLYNNGGGMWRK